MPFSISAKIQDGSRNSEKSKFFSGLRGVVLRTWGSKICLKSPYLLRFPRKTTFSNCAKIQDGSQIWKKSNFFRGPRGVVLCTLWNSNTPLYWKLLKLKVTYSSAKCQSSYYSVNITARALKIYDREHQIFDKKPLNWILLKLHLRYSLA